MFNKQTIGMAKVFLSLMWLVTGACFFFPADSLVVEAGRLVFVVTLVAHVVECGVFWGTIRRSGKPVSGQIGLVLLFGVFQYADILLDVEAADREPR